MSATLATSSDPVVLIPGSLEALYDDARSLESHADGLDDAAAAVRRRAVPRWLGSAAAGWDERRPALADAAGAPAQVYRSAAEVLRAHAATLEWAREECHVAIGLWRTGVAQASHVGLQCVAPGLGTPVPWSRGGAVAGVTFGAGADGVDAGAQTRATAVRLLETLRQEVTLSAEAAAELLDSWCADLPDGRFHAADVLAGIGDWARGVATLLVTFNLARTVYDAEGYWRDVRGTYQGTQDLVRHLSQHPEDANRLLLDSETWRDNPGRWWGAVAPDLVLGVVGGGAGVMGRLARVSDLPAGVARVPDLPRFTASRAQLEKKLKHAPEFGVTLPRGRQALARFEDALAEFVDAPTTVRVEGFYHRDPVILNYDPDTKLVVIQRPDGTFLSGWRLTTPQLVHVTSERSLGGGPGR